MQDLLARAKDKFEELDTNRDGVLDGDEILELTNWVWWSFHPSGTALTEKQRREMAATLLRRVDSNHDGVISFEEFANW